MIAVVWRFEVKPGQERAFELFYGVNGDWAALSRRSRSYLGTSFLHEVAEPTRFHAIDYWSEMIVYEQHKTDYLAEIRALEDARDAMVSRMEVRICQAIDVPDRTGPTYSRRQV
jgi:hypothetical protein